MFRPPPGVERKAIFHVGLVTFALAVVVGFPFGAIVAKSVFGDFSPAAGFGWYLFAGIEGRAVARNIFLDGNTFRDSRSVDGFGSLSLSVKY